VEGVERKLKDFGLVLDGKGHKSDIEKLESVILAGIDKRLTTIEEKHVQDFIKRLADYERKHMTDIDQMRSRLSDVDKALKECANIEHYLGLDKKHGALTEQQMKDAEAARGRFGELDSKMLAAEATLDGIARKVTDQQGSLMRKIAGLEAVEDGFKKRLDELGSKLAAAPLEKLDDRITRVENMVSGSVGAWARDLESAQGNAREASGKIEAQKGSLENFRMLVDQRFSKLEAGLEGAAGHDT
jgi:uncharacterized coiled-coil protein SlyX